MKTTHAAALIALILPAALAATGHADEDFHHDFRGQPLPAELTIFQPENRSFIKAEAEGLRIVLPKDRQPLATVGVARTVPIRGDFEITLTYEILEAEAPPPFNFGVGVNVYVKKVAPVDEGATLCRLATDNGRQVIFWDRSILVPEKQPTFVGSSTPCSDKVGRLRLHRSGTVLYYLAAPGVVGDNFTQIHRCEFGAEDIQCVELRGTTGRYPCKLDARFLEVRMRSGAIGPVAGLVTPPPPPEKGRRLWLLLAAAAMIVLMGAGLVLRRFVRRTGPVVAVPPTNAVEVLCPHCQKRLHVPANMAGKNVKCPACAKVFVA